MKLPLSWIIVADGGAVKVYCTTGETGQHKAILKLVLNGTFYRKDPAHFGPRPGKNFSSALRDSGHGVTTHENERRHAEKEFIAAVFSWIERSENLASFERLIIAAPPRILGEIRMVLSPVLVRRLYREIHGDLTKLPIKELEQRVMKSMLDLCAETKAAS